MHVLYNLFPHFLHIDRYIGLLLPWTAIENARARIRTVESTDRSSRMTLFCIIYLALLNNDITWQYPHHAQYFYRSIVLYFFESLNVFSFSFQKTGPLRSLQRQQMSAVSGEPPGLLQPLSQWGRAGVHSGWTVGRNDPRVPASGL